MGDYSGWEIVEEEPDYSAWEIFNEQPESGKFQPEDYQSPGQAAIGAVKRAPGRAASMGLEALTSLFTVPTALATQPIESRKHGLYGLAEGMRNLTENVPGNIIDYRKEFQRKRAEKDQELPSIPSFTKLDIPEEWLDKIKGFLTPSDEFKQQSQQLLDTLRPESQGHGLEAIQGMGRFAPGLAATGGNLPAASALTNIGENRNVFEDLLPIIGAQNAGPLGKKAVEFAKKKAGFKPAAEIRQNASTTAKGMADKLAIEDLSEAQKLGSELYNSLIGDTKEAGITKAEIKRARAPQFFEDASKNQKSGVVKAFRTQKITDIHDAYKDLGQYIAEAKNKRTKGTLTSTERKALEQAEKIRSNMAAALNDAFEKAGGAEFTERFSDANKHWQDKVIPNESNPILKKYREGELTPEDFIKSASNNKKFRAQLAAENAHIPEFAQVLKDMEQLEKAPPNSAEAKQLQKDVKRHLALSKGVRKTVSEGILKMVGLGGLLK